MNNSKIIIDNFENEPLDRNEVLQRQQGQLSQIVEALNRVEASEDWQKLKALVLDGIVEAIERQLKNQSNATKVDLPELYRLQGQLVWAKKYADLKQFADSFRKQIEGIKLTLKK